MAYQVLLEDTVRPTVGALNRKTEYIYMLLLLIMFICVVALFLAPAPGMRADSDKPRSRPQHIIHRKVEIEGGIRTRIQGVDDTLGITTFDIRENCLQEKEEGSNEISNAHDIIDNDSVHGHGSPHPIATP